MGHHNARVEWHRDNAKFTDNRYSRAHEWSFDGGVRVPASSSPNVVPVPLSDPNAIDPEEAFVGALASCHMLWFLSIAAKRGFVDKYEDDAVGELAKNDEGRMAMKTVTLRPAVTFGGDAQPSRDERKYLAVFTPGAELSCPVVEFREYLRPSPQKRQGPLIAA